MLVGADAVVAKVHPAVGRIAGALIVVIAFPAIGTGLTAKGIVVSAADLSCRYIALVVIGRADTVLTRRASTADVAAGAAVVLVGFPIDTFGTAANRVAAAGIPGAACVA